MNAKEKVWDRLTTRLIYPKTLEAAHAQIWKIIWASNGFLYRQLRKHQEETGRFLLKKNFVQKLDRIAFKQWTPTETELTGYMQLFAAFDIAMAAARTERFQRQKKSRV